MTAPPGGTADGRPARDRHGSGTQGWLAWLRLTAVAEQATIGVGYFGCALVRLAIHMGGRLGRGESSPRHRHRARGAPVVAKYTGVLAAADEDGFTLDDSPENCGCWPHALAPAVTGSR
jgi:hypothetical protein